LAFFPACPRFFIAAPIVPRAYDLLSFISKRIFPAAPAAP
jgi:hypothetical protein